MIVKIRFELFQAESFSESFEDYSYLWLDDRASYMQQFLDYGRQLTMEEMEMIAMVTEAAQGPELCPPTMDQFREQVYFLLCPWYR